MPYKIKILKLEDHPPLLTETPKPPTDLYYAGAIPDYSRKFLCIVGSRKYTNYGKECVDYIVSGLAGYPITIVSGLAIGIDSIAHRAAIKNNLPTIAVPGSGLKPESLHPATHVRLAEEIIECGGTLLSEFEPGFKATQWSFPQRNRIMAGMSHATLVVEAETKSGTMITSKLAGEYNREVMAIPGSILSSTSEGPNMLLRIGATPIRSSEDILESFGLLNKKIESYDSKNLKTYEDCGEKELAIIALISKPIERDEILRQSVLPVPETQQILGLLELKGIIEEKLGEIRLI